MARAIFFAAIIALVAVYSREAFAETTVNPSSVDPAIAEHTCSGTHEEVSHDCTACEKTCCHAPHVQCNTGDSSCEGPACVCDPTCVCKRGFARNDNQECVHETQCDCTHETTV